MSFIIYKKPDLFALVDCNNFYVSCERAFNPRLENKPVVVLSNNDGCIISRSNEAKKLGVPMGAPYFKWKSFCAQHHVNILSSNYELYGDMSQRVMEILKQYTLDIEVYSIDEAFLHLPVDVKLTELIELREQVKKQTGIPISIGIAKTKTLAKMANQLAKNNSLNGFFSLIEPEQHQHHFANFPVEKIWGVGRRLAEKLKGLGLDTAEKLCLTDAKIIRTHFSVTLEKTVQELQGLSCLDLDLPQPRKQIISSRSFGKLLTELHDLEEAISHYTNTAALKLRKQHHAASAIYVFLQTSMFREKKSQYGNGVMFPFPAPTADTRYLIHTAKKCLKHIYRKKYKYNKAGIMLLDIVPQSVKQYDLLLNVIDDKSDRLMSAIDSINKEMGKNTLFFAAEGTKREWLIKCEKRSPRYTTRWGELSKVIC